MNKKFLLLIIFLTPFLLFSCNTSAMKSLFALVATKLDQSKELDKNGNNLIHKACLELSHAKLKIAMEKYKNSEEKKQAVLHKNKMGFSPLLNMTNNSPETRRFSEIQQDQINKIAKSLLPFYDIANIKKDGSILLFFASEIGSKELARLLYLNGAEIPNRMSVCKKEFISYYEIMKEYDRSENKVKLLKSKIEQKILSGKLDELDELIEICYCRSVCSIFDDKLPYEETVFFKILDQSNYILLKEVFNKNLIMRYDLAIEAINFRKFLEKKSEEFFVFEETMETEKPAEGLKFEKNNAKLQVKHEKVKSQDIKRSIASGILVSDILAGDKIGKKTHSKAKSLDAAASKYLEARLPLDFTLPKDKISITEDKITKSQEAPENLIEPAKKSEVKIIDPSLSETKVTKTTIIKRKKPKQPDHTDYKDHKRSVSSILESPSLNIKFGLTLTTESQTGKSKNKSESKSETSKSESKTPEIRTKKELETKKRLPEAKKDPVKPEKAKAKESGVRMTRTQILQKQAKTKTKFTMQ